MTRVADAVSMETKLIEVLVLETGDRASADTPEAALVAALTLCRDVLTNSPDAGLKPTVTFLVDGVCVRHGVAYAALCHEDRP